MLATSAWVSPGPNLGGSTRNVVIRPRRPDPVWAYGLAILLPLLTSAAQHFLYSWIGGPPGPFLLTYPVVFLVGWFGGLGPGLLATLLSALAAWYLFLPPPFTLAAPQLPDLLKLAVFVAMGGLFSALVPGSRRRVQELNLDFLTLLDHTTDFIYFKDRDSRIRFCSRALAKLCGYGDWRELIGKHDREIFPPEIARLYEEEELQVFREGKPLLDKIDPYIGVEGDRRWVTTNKWPVLAKDRKTVVGIFGISRDVTGRMQAVQELREQALKHETLLRLASDGIHVLDSNGNILEANEAFCRMLGYSHEEALGLNVARWDARWSERELQEERLPSVLDHPQLFETRHRRRDGTIFDVEVSAARVDVGGVRMIYAASRDISERKRAEEALRRSAQELSEASRMKDIFTDVLRHDILNPVTAIRTSTELLLRKEADAGKAALLRKIQLSTANLGEMTENAALLASLTAGQAPELTPGDPVLALRSVLPDFEHKLAEKQLTLTDHSGGGFPASFHPMLAELFANLLSNAIKYSPGGTRIDVGVEDRGESWLFFVRDQGSGVPEEHKQRIFNRFERLGKEGVKGSGLGLAIAKQIVSLHGGKIWVEDNPSGGSVFFASLPKRPPAGPAEPQRA